eukprot:TRINITY_DN5942_c0_g1_i1.p1 TRINITY_DN5942_c0_g1~~TRINITY_DN5942_c0_g1_i1.p1  ORF type:complete len:510 (+),score=120.04 TRINITY_DN5942_c0_g1_i1:38-1531(+)
MAFLLHLTVKISETKSDGDWSSLDNYAVLWLSNADWDKYKTSTPATKSSAIQLFLHKPSNLQIEMFDKGIKSSTSLGVATLNLFDSKGNLLDDLPVLDKIEKNLPLMQDKKKKGTVKVEFLLHYIYQSSKETVPDIPVVYPFKNLVLEGGGVRGIAYGGTLGVLGDKGILKNIERIAGTSAGSIAGLCLALGADAARIEKALQEIDFASFADGNFVTSNGVALHEGNALAESVRRLISQLLTEKNVTSQQLQLSNLQDITFAQLKQLTEDPNYSGTFKLFYAIGTKLVDFSFDRFSKKEEYDPLEMKVFSADTTPDLRLWEATRISMSVPFFFKPVEYEGSYYVDGGVLYNYAINIFDENGVANEETLGLRVDQPDELATFLDSGDPKADKISQDFIKENEGSFKITQIGSILVNHFTGNLAIYKTTQTDDGRSVFINTGSIKTTDFGIQKPQKDGLIVYGKEWCTSFFTWWDQAYRKDPRPTGPLDAAGKVKTKTK